MMVQSSELCYHRRGKEDERRVLFISATLAGPEECSAVLFSQNSRNITNEHAKNERRAEARVEKVGAK